MSHECEACGESFDETGIVDDLPEDWTLPDLDPGPLSDIDEELLSQEG